MRPFGLVAVVVGIGACAPLFESGSDCTNGVDDDGNTLVDCEDPACALSPLCGLCGNGKIDPGKVFDLTLPLERVAEGYRAMDQRSAVKALLVP